MRQGQDEIKCNRVKKTLDIQSGINDNSGMGSNKKTKEENKMQTWRTASFVERRKIEISLLNRRRELESSYKESWRGEMESIEEIQEELANVLAQLKSIDKERYNFLRGERQC